MDPPELAPGQTVKFQGLNGAAHLNGTEGTVVRFDTSEQRWVIRCTANNTMVKAKPENLVIIATAFDSANIQTVVVGQDDDALNDVDASDAHWRAQRSILPGISVADYTIQCILEFCRRIKKITNVAIEDCVVGIGIGCNFLSAEGLEGDKLAYEDLISKRLGTRGMQVLDRKSLSNLCPCDAAIVMRDECQEMSEDISLIYRALRPNGLMHMLIRFDQTRKGVESREVDLDVIHQNILKDFPLSIWYTCSSRIICHTDLFVVISLAKRTCAVNAWRCPLGDQIPSDRLVSTYNKTEEFFPMEGGVSYLTYQMGATNTVTIDTSAKERKAGGEIAGSAIKSEVPVFGTILTNAHVKMASETLQKYGFVIIKGLLPPSQTILWGDAALSDLTSAVTRLKCHPTQPVDLLNPSSAKVQLSYQEMTVKDLHVDLRSGPEMDKLSAAENNHVMLSMPDSSAMSKRDAAAINNGSTMIHADTKGTVDSWRFHPSILAIIKNVFNPRTRKGPLYKGNLGRLSSAESGLDGSPQPFRLGQIGSMISCPGASQQDIHADTSHLFEHDICLPSHSLKVITPGYQVSKDSIHTSCDEFEFTDEGIWTGNATAGGMAFVYGSHKLDVAARLMSQEYCNDNDRTRKEMLRARTIHPSLEVGDVLIFDSRIIHFNMDNIRSKNNGNSKLEREVNAGFLPMLYFNASQAWFQESTIVVDMEKVFN